MSRTTPKTPKHTGIAKAKREKKRVEAEKRNALTPPERTRSYRRRLENNE